MARIVRRGQKKDREGWAEKAVALSLGNARDMSLYLSEGEQRNFSEKTARQGIVNRVNTLQFAVKAQESRSGSEWEAYVAGKINQGRTFQ